MAKWSDFDWTESATCRLRELWLQTNPVLTTRQVGNLLGCSKNAVIGRARRIGLPSRGSPLNLGICRPRIQRTRYPTVTLKPLASVKLTARQVASFGRRSPLPPAPVLEPEVVKIFARKSEPCCFVTTAGRPWGYCDAPSVPGKPYCPTHDHLCNMAPRDRPVNEAQYKPLARRFG